MSPAGGSGALDADEAAASISVLPGNVESGDVVRELGAGAPSAASSLTAAVTSCRDLLVGAIGSLSAPGGSMIGSLR